jgi:hypothetical protein
MVFSFFQFSPKVNIIHKQDLAKFWLQEIETIHRAKHHHQLVVGTLLFDSFIHLFRHY